MIKQTALIELQKRQRDHDREFHHDIYTLPYPQRMDHYILHYSKYVGRLSREYENEEIRKQVMKKTLADSFIVALANANTLNINLSQEVGSLEPETAVVGDDDFSSEPKIGNHSEIQDWWFREYADSAGAMANVMESRDHMESMNIRDEFEKHALQIVEILLEVSRLTQMNIEEVVSERWEELESNSIFK